MDVSKLTTQEVCASVYKEYLLQRKMADYSRQLFGELAPVYDPNPFSDDITANAPEKEIRTALTKILANEQAAIEAMTKIENYINTYFNGLLRAKGAPSARPNQQIGT